MLFFLFQSLPQSAFIIFISTFVGALAGEFYRENNNKVPCSLFKFLSRFFASWIMAFATILFIQSTFEINKNEMLISISIFYGFVGHKKTLKFIQELIDSKFKSNK